MFGNSVTEQAYYGDRVGKFCGKTLSIGQKSREKCVEYAAGGDCVTFRLVLGD